MSEYPNEDVETDGPKTPRVPSDPHELTKDPDLLYAICVRIEEEQKAAHGRLDNFAQRAEQQADEIQQRITAVETSSNGIQRGFDARTEAVENKIDALIDDTRSMNSKLDRIITHLFGAHT